MAEEQAITSQIQILDDISAIDNIINKVDDFIQGLERLDSVAQGTFKTFDTASGIRFPDVPDIPIQAQSEPMIQPPIPEFPTVPEPQTPPEITPINWNTQGNIDIFNNSGIERFRQEMSSLDTQMQQLMNNQTQIDNLADNMDIIPNNMITDINALNQRILNLGNSIQNIEREGLDDIGADRVNNQVERLRGQLNNALQSQTSLNGAIRNMDASEAQREYQRLNNIIDNAEREIRDNINAQNQFNSSVSRGQSEAEGLTNKIGGLVKTYLGLQTIKSGAGFVKDALDFTNVQIQAETKLATVMNQRMKANENMIQSVKDLASEQQGIGVVGDEVQLAGAAQVATFLSSTKALKNLMPAMNNLAVAQKGVNVTSEDMYNIGNMVGKVMQGQTSALTRAGITFSEAEEKAIKYGNEADRAAALASVIENNVGKMNEAMANTPQGQLQQISNAWGDMKEEIGAALYPTVLNLFSAINTNMPAIKQLFTLFGQALVPIINFLGMIITMIGNVYNYVSENWSTIGPIVEVIAVSIGILAGAFLAYKVAMLVATAAQWLFNTALYGCPLIWIILAIVAIVAAIYIVIAAINEWTDSSISATGVIFGCITTLVAFIWNIIVAVVNFIIDRFVSLWNFIAAFANFFGNVFDDPIGSVARLFFDLVDNVLELLQSLAEAIDTIFGSELASSVQGWRDGLSGWVDDTFGKGEEIMQKITGDEYKLDRWAYEDAWNTGYEAGESVDSFFSDGLEGFDGLDNLTDKSGNTSIGPVDNGLGNVAGGDVAGGNVDKVGKVDKVGGTVDVSSEDLKRMRDIYENDVIQEVYATNVTPQVNIQFGDVKETADVDKIIGLIRGKIKESININAEGVH